MTVTESQNESELTGRVADMIAWLKCQAAQINSAEKGKVVLPFCGRSLRPRLFVFSCSGPIRNLNRAVRRRHSR